MNMIFQRQDARVARKNTSEGFPGDPGVLALKFLWAVALLTQAYAVTTTHFQPEVLDDRLARGGLDSRGMDGGAGVRTRGEKRKST